MSFPTQIRALFETAKVIDHTGVGASYAVVGSPTSNSASVIIFTSTFDEAIYLSTDGTNDMLLIPPNEAPFTLNLGANKQGVGKFSLPSRTQFYIKQGPDGAPSDGDLSISIIYGES